MPRYRETTPTPSEKHLAQLTIEVCSARLGIREPEIAFIRESPTGDIVQESRVLGLADSLKIWLLAGMEPRKLVRVAAHECRHVKHFFRSSLNRESRERDANLYSWEFVQDLNLRGRTMDEAICEMILFKE